MGKATRKKEMVEHRLSERTVRDKIARERVVWRVVHAGAPDQNVKIDVE